MTRMLDFVVCHVIFAVQMYSPGILMLHIRLDYFKKASLFKSGKVGMNLELYR
jgi:hypothetical protein